MSTEKRERILSLLQTIQADCEADAMSIDGKPFDGKTVAPILGEMYATMLALARVCEELIRESEAA